MYHLVSFSLNWCQCIVAEWNVLYTVSFLGYVVKIKESFPFFVVIRSNKLLFLLTIYLSCF